MFRTPDWPRPPLPGLLLLPAARRGAGADLRPGAAHCCPGCQTEPRRGCTDRRSSVDAPAAAAETTVAATTRRPHRAPAAKPTTARSRR